MKGIFLILLFLALTIPVFADHVYTEAISYELRVLEKGQIEIKQITRVYKDGTEISKGYVNYVKTPGANVIKEPERVKAVANAVWTQEVIDAYKTR